MQSIREYVLTHTPRCIAGVEAIPTTLIEERKCDAVAYLLGSAGEQFAEIRGFDLRRYNPDYRGPRQFISPLSLIWNRHSTSVIVFDSDIHDYHGEMGASAHFRGKGESEIIECPKCHGKLFSVRVQFDYWDACNDLWEDEPEINVEDYFCNIIFEGECTSCGNRTLFSKWTFDGKNCGTQS